MNDLLENNLDDLDLEEKPHFDIDESFNDLVEGEDQEVKNESSIKNFFEIANENVKAATEIFNKSVAMKDKLLQQAEALKKQRKDHEEKTKLEVERITAYRDELKEKGIVIKDTREGTTYEIE